MKIIAIYYKPDVFDCYTVYFDFVEKRQDGKIFIPVLE